MRGSSCRGCCRPRRTAGRWWRGRCWMSRPRRWSGGWRCGWAGRGWWGWGGGGGVMRAQLERLLEACVLPRVTLQVLPFGAGAHPAMVGAFTVLRFEDAEVPDVVYLEHLTNAVYLDKREEVEHYIYVMESIGLRSAPPHLTPDILHRIMRENEAG